MTIAYVFWGCLLAIGLFLSWVIWIMARIDLTITHDSRNEEDL